MSALVSAPVSEPELEPALEPVLARGPEWARGLAPALARVPAPALAPALVSGWEWSGWYYCCSRRRPTHSGRSPRWTLLQMHACFFPSLLLLRSLSPQRQIGSIR